MKKTVLVVSALALTGLALAAPVGAVWAVQTNRSFTPEDACVAFGRAYGRGLRVESSTYPMQPVPTISGVYWVRVWVGPEATTQAAYDRGAELWRCAVRDRGIGWTAMHISPIP